MAAAATVGSRDSDWGGLGIAQDVTGTALVLLCLAAGVLLSPWWLLAAPPRRLRLRLGGPLLRGEEPARHLHLPALVALGDFRMVRLTRLGKMGPEIERATRLYPSRA
jgi:hypothetical protein